MSVKPFPTCKCAGFNYECYDEGLILPDYINPIPDPEPVPVRTLLSSTSFALNTSTVFTNSAWLIPQAFTAPPQANNYDAFVFGAGTNMAPTTTTGSTTVGAAFSLSCPCSSASGAGINALSLTAFPTSVSANIVYQPNFTNPTISTVWGGTFTINWASSTITIKTTTSGTAASITAGYCINVSSTFNCPSSFVIFTVITAGSTFGIYKGTTDTSYYTIPSTTVLTGTAQNSRKSTGSASVSGTTLTTTATVIGLNVGQFVVSANYTYLVTQLVSATTYRIIGIGGTFNANIGTFNSYTMFNGVDVVFNPYVLGAPTMATGAIIRGALYNSTLTPNNSTGGILIGAQIAAETSTYPAVTGAVSQSTSTNSYPTGLVPLTVGPVVSTSANSFGGTTGVKASANSGAFSSSNYTSSGFTTATTICGLGGILINWYSLVYV